MGGNGDHQNENSGRREPQKVAIAWAVHAFTVSGIVLGFLALVALLNGDRAAVFMWLGLALFVDGIDGTLARKVRVREVTPNVDGATLDNVIDYFNYVAVPAMMIYWFELVPGGWETVTAATVMVVSCYTFANTGMKTSDYYFSGFPALWNLMVLYFYILQTSQMTNLIVIAVCAVLTFIPVKCVHPFRVGNWRGVTIPMTVLWAATTLRLVLIPPDVTTQQKASSLFFWLWVAASAYFVGLSLWRSFTPARGDEQAGSDQAG